MLIKSKHLIFIPSLLMGSMITISSSSWFSAWMGLEINLMSMAPILINKMLYRSVEASIKYFLVQAVASTILIMCIFLNSNFSMLNMTQFSELIISLSLITKAGVAPLHFWFPQVMMFIEWPQCLMILTWQKIAPFIMLSFMNNFSLLTSIILSALIGLMGGINQINMKLILTYSSIIHSSWMLSIIIFNELIWAVYLSLYSFLIFAASFIFLKLNLSHFNSINFFKNSPSMKFIFLTNFLSMAGLPPFLGFLIKILALITLLKFNLSIFLLLILIISSFLSFYFYSRMTYNSLFVSSNFIVYSNHTPLYSSNTFIFIMLSFMGGLVIPLFFIMS